MANFNDAIGIQLPPEHVAIIMDGNGRWAKRRGLARLHGHRNGVEAVKNIVKAAADQGIKYLTLYSFSTENWSRPQEEVGELMGLLKMFIRKDLAELHQNNVRLKIIGDRDTIPNDIGPLLLEAEALTKNNTDITLIIAFNYGSRDEIKRATIAIAEKVKSGELNVNQIDNSTIEQHLDTADFPDPDLIIRTSGESRLSNFLMWQAAYSELVFVDCMWPEFTGQSLKEAIIEFNSRNRRYGGLTQSKPKEVGK